MIYLLSTQQNMAGSRFCLVIFIASILICSSYSSRPSFESGIRTLVSQRDAASMVQESSNIQFTILFKQSYSTPPLVLLSPLTFTTNKEEAYSQVLGRVRLFSTTIKRNKLGIDVNSTTRILSVRASYLFIERQVAHSLSLYILDQYNQE
jgi:hypothetical protein